MRRAIIAYVPVLHEGYRRLFANHPDARELFLFGHDVIHGFEHLVKDIRRIDPELVQKSVAAWNMFDEVKILDTASIEELVREKVSVIASDDDITTELVQKYFPHNPVEVDSIFLRWDKKTAVEPLQISPDVKISSEEFDKKMIALAEAEGKKSRDWWRRIGGVVVKDGKIILEQHNVYVPNEQIAYDEGDPRGNFKSGVNLESSLALHAEAGMVARAARDGVSLKGTDVYVENFPCPPCAKQLAYAGIRRLYYRIGYKVLDGERILKSQGVEIIFVQ